ncbi:M14 family metallopeptidase [Flavobacterium terrae]|uniref:Zinc carboxypeptidase n=1 Tax=Flavobacterium terrae TaxID=415425 RepID=A0A1M6ECL2_9FLAO|nr:M14 metallopeptidase family protein [Flavobacterium terrae]SHI83048.1 Zinc carboxypeptidase [Flavobacterium terrae]
MDLNNIYSIYKEVRLKGRYITNKHIEPILKSLPDFFNLSVIGKSVNGKPIYSVKIGTGNTKVFMWSQMHGNESTTTKALFDLFLFLNGDSNEANQIRNDFTLLIIPILNPDGAEAYTRVNANEIDLNRDSVDLSQPESKLLRKTFEEFEPDFCYNLHDQRTIFAAGDKNYPATVSFLAPSYNNEKEYNKSRLKAVNVIAEMNEELQKYIPNQVGRFDDSFNINCIGDMFQSLGVPTILFEAGHYQDDYEREETRKFIFISILSSLLKMKEIDFLVNKLNNYLKIPQNKINFYDIIYKKIKINDGSLKRITNFAAHYKEVLIENDVIFEAFVVEIGDEISRFGHLEYDCEGLEYSDNFNNIPEIDRKADFYLDKDKKFVNGLNKM